MSLLDIFEDKTSFSTKYFGINDLATSMDVKVLITNYNDITSYFKNKKNEITNLDGFIDYLLMKKISEMSEISPLIVEDSNRKKFDSIIDTVNPILKQIENRDLISYINRDYENIFSQESFDLIEECVDLIITFKGGIDTEVYEYILSAKSFLIIDHYDDLQSVIEKKDVLLNEISSESAMNLNYSTRLIELMGIARKLEQKDDKGKNEFGKKMISNIIKYGENIHKNLTLDNSYVGQDILSKILQFLERGKNVEANEFRIFMEDANRLADEQLKTHGTSTEYTLPIHNVIEQLEKQKNFNLMMMNLTHYFGKDKYKSIFSDKSPGKQGFSDYVGSNSPTDDYFTFSFQLSLNSKLQLCSATLFELSNRHKNIYEWFISEIKDIDNKIKSSERNLSYEAEIVMNLLSELKNTKDTISIKGLSYTTSVAVCGLIEKLLRSFYYDLTIETQYVAISKVVLSSLIDPQNEYMKNVFGEYHLKALKFFLSTDSESGQSELQNKIGHDYRNKLAHMRDIQWDQMSILFPYSLFYLLLDILNTINLELFPEKYKKLK